MSYVCCCSFFRKNNPLLWTIVAGDDERTLKESTEQVRNVFKSHFAYTLSVVTCQEIPLAKLYN